MNDFQLQLISNLLAYSVQRDISLEQLCHLSGIDAGLPAQLLRAAVTDKQVNDLWMNASHLCNDPLFGLHFGESLQLTALGLVGQLVQTSQTVGQALTHAAGFMPLLTNLFTMTITQAHPSFTVRLIPVAERIADYPIMGRHLLDVSMILLLHEVDGLVLEKIKPQSVTLPYSVPDRAEYERILRCPVIETAEEYTLVFDARYWNLPILTANYELQAVLLQMAMGLSTPSRPSPLTKERIYAYLVTNAYLGIPSLEAMAANFNTSSRSLQRKLRQEGATYQQVADSIQKSLATAYVASGRYPIKEISYLMGFNELSAFSRAFKRWTGTSPGNYQNR